MFRFILSVLILVLILVLIFNVVLATTIETQTSTNQGSNNSLNIFSTWSEDKKTKYINKDNNSDIIWDFLSGYYYNTLFGFFKLDWSTDKQKNVRIIGSTSKCWQWYWYKFSWYAKSDTAGLIDFDYNENTFVYYCLKDKKLYWKAYSHTIWYQIFDGISLEILPNFNSQIINTNSDKIFINNTTTIFSNNIITTNTNKNLNVSWETQSVKYWQEAIFYIWKPKKK